jgi:hypothetical protein
MTASDPAAIVAVLIAAGMLACAAIIAWGLRHAHDSSTYHQYDSIVPERQPPGFGRRGQ